MNISIKDEFINDINQHCYRFKDIPLVFIGTYKSASTYYTTLLLDNGWERIKFLEIDWSKDRVFSFIADPKCRFYKGIVEDIKNSELDADIAGTDPNEVDNYIYKGFKDYKKHLLILTEHSLPVTFRLQDYINKIDWIPIFDNFPHHDMFLKLLAEYNITVKPGPNLDPNCANGAKQSEYEKYKQLIDPPSKIYNIVMAGNLDLFEKVKKNINPAAQTWQETSWLRHKLPV